MLQLGRDYGSLLERHVIRSFLRGLTSLECFALGDPSAPISLPFSDTFHIKYFDQMENSFSNSTGRQMVFIPESQIYKAWDFIVHSPASNGSSERLVFIQVSKNLPREHDGPLFTIKKSFEPKLDKNTGKMLGTSSCT